MSNHRLGAPRLAFRLQALAAAAVLACAGMPAGAQFYSYDGAVSTYPVNLFPIDVDTALLDFGNNILIVGASAAGSFSALSGAQLVAAGMDVADGGGNGSVTVAGPGTLVSLTGTAINRLQVGNWGTGALTVSGGAVIDAASNLAGCTSCYSFVGNAAGSTASMTITGAGSEVRTARVLGIGQTAVSTVASGGFDFGTPGGTTNASVDILAGGTLRSQATTVAFAPTPSPASTGTETAFATVRVDGAGSRWIVTPNTVDNQAAGLTIGNGARAHAEVTVSNGALLMVDGSGGSGPNDFVNIGVNGASGTLGIAGTGSSFVMTGVNPVLQVGRSGVGAVGSFNVIAGATASTLFLNVGRDGAVGNVLIDGAGSRLTLSGVTTAAGSQVANAPAFASIGGIGGTAGSGSVTVSNGGRFAIDDGGGDTRLTGSPGIILGRGAGSSGSLTISGAGSVVSVTSTSLGVPAGSADNYNPFVAVGYDNAATAAGTLTVSNGGKLLLTGSAVSNTTTGRTTSVNIGGYGRVGATVAGTGTATVTGAGSEIALAGYDRFVGVGRGAGGSGRLNVLDHGRVSSTSMAVGESTTGIVTIDNATIALDGYRTDSSNTGAGATIGRGSGGVGTLDLSNGAAFTINSSVLAGGISIGGDAFASGGSGSVSLAGGSSLTIGGSVSGGSLSIGRSGIGTLSVVGASTIDVGNTRTIYLGREVGGAGTMTVSGGSLVSGNVVDIGGSSDDAATGSGAATVSGAGSLLRATGDSGFIAVGRSGVGSLALSSGARVEAIVMNVGRAAGSNGTLTLDNATLALAGQQTSGNFTGAALTVGNRGGTGNAVITNGSVVTITNAGGNGASLNVGGTQPNPLGTGTLTVANGSSITVSANAGAGLARIGYDGTGSATFSGGSTLSVAGGQVLIGGAVGGVGRLDLQGSSAVTAAYVGIGSSPTGDTGTGVLHLDHSTVTASTVEIGGHGTLNGDGGLIAGELVVRGLVAPGDSPGRVTINGGLETTAGAQLLLDVQETSAGSYAVDNVVLVQGSSFEFTNVAIVFHFIGSTDPNAFGASGQFDLDTFLRSAPVAGGSDTGLSAVFAPGQDWNTVLASATYTATSDDYVIDALRIDSDGSGNFFVQATPTPEPATIALWLAGAAVIGSRMLRRR